MSYKTTLIINELRQEGVFGELYIVFFYNMILRKLSYLGYKKTPKNRGKFRLFSDLV